VSASTRASPRPCSNELSKQIKARGDAHPVEGAFFSNENTNSITYAGAVITPSLVGTDFDMALYRLRQPSVRAIHRVQ
jgi:hypothetical protein